MNTERSITITVDHLTDGYLSNFGTDKNGVRWVKLALANTYGEDCQDCISVLTQQRDELLNTIEDIVECLDNMGYVVPASAAHKQLQKLVTKIKGGE